MYTVDLYLRVRLACHVDSSQREAASRFGIARETVKKMLRHSEPPGYRRRQPPKRPKLAPFTDIIDRILEEDRTVVRTTRRSVSAFASFTGKETIEGLCGAFRDAGHILRCSQPLARRMRSFEFFRHPSRCLLRPGGGDVWTARRRSPIDSLRPTSSGVAHLVRWHAATNAGVQRAAVPFTSSSTAVPARVTTKAMWRICPAELHDAASPVRELGRLQWP